MEALLENVAQQLMTRQVLMQEKIDRFSVEREMECKRLDEMWANTDRRIAVPVRATADLISREDRPV